MGQLRRACLERAQAALRTFGLDRADVEDLVHDFLATRLGDLARDDLESPETYFCVCVRNAARDKLRTEKRRRELLAREGAPKPETRGPADVFALARLRVALAGVPERHRAIFLAAIEGDDRDALGRAFHTSRANVDQIVRRTRVLLARALNEEDAP